MDEECVGLTAEAFGDVASLFFSLLVTVLCPLDSFLMSYKSVRFFGGECGLVVPLLFPYVPKW